MINETLSLSAIRVLAIAIHIIKANPEFFKKFLAKLP